MCGPHSGVFDSAKKTWKDRTKVAEGCAGAVQKDCKTIVHQYFTLANLKMTYNTRKTRKTRKDYIQGILWRDTRTDRPTDRPTRQGVE